MYKLKKRHLLASILFALMIGGNNVCSADVTKNKNVTIKGSVADEQGNALEGVSVWNKGTYRGAVSNAEGLFALDVPKGNVEIRVSFVGYKTEELTLVVVGDTVLNISLKPLAVMCDAVIVSATKSGENTPLTSSTLNRKDIENNTISGALPYMLELEPSMVSTAENGTSVGNTSFRIRGTDATRINVNINGIPLNNPESQGVYWVNIVNLAAMAESVEIQRGTGSANGGTSAFGGAVSLQTLNASQQPYAVADISRGAFNTNQTSLMVGSGMLKNGLVFDASYSKLSSDGFLRNGFCDHESLYLGAGYYGEKTLLKVVAIVGEQHTGITWNGATKEEIANDPTFNNAGAYYDDMGNLRYYDNETDNYWQQHLQMYFSHQLAKNWLLNIAANYTHGYGYYENYKADKKFTAYGLPYQMVVNNNDTTLIKYSDFVVRKLMNNHSYTETASLKYDTDKLTFTAGQMINHYDGEHYGNVIWCKMPSVLTDYYEWYTNIGRKTDISVFAKAEYSVGNHWNSYADLQYRLIWYNMSGIDDDNMLLDFAEVYSFFNPKVGLTYSVNANDKFTFLAGIANREPTRADIKDAIKSSTSDAPKPETMLDVELGYSRSNTLCKLAANAYFMGYRNQLVSSGKLNSVGYALMENVDKSYRLGLEVVAGVKICRWLKVDANITLSKNKVLNYICYQEHYDNPNDWNTTPQVAVNCGNTQLAFSPNVVGAALVTIEPIKNLKLQLTAKYVGEQYYDNTERDETRLAPYCVANTKCSYLHKLNSGREIEFQLLVNNIFDKQYINNAWGYEAYFDDGSEKYIEQGFFVQPGINATARMVIRL